MGGDGQTISSCSSLELKGRLFDATAVLTLDNHVKHYTEIITMLPATE